MILGATWVQAKSLTMILVHGELWPPDLRALLKPKSVTTSSAVSSVLAVQEGSFHCSRDHQHRPAQAEQRGIRSTWLMCNNHSEWKVSQKVKKQHQPQQHNTVSIHSLISRECREIYNLPPQKNWIITPYIAGNWR